MMDSEWGPLAALVGSWEGDGGIDTAYSHHHGKIVCTPYRERATFEPFGPVHNGRQQLFGLDYRAAMWRGHETVPFHAEVGYWLWDPESGEVLRAFVVPRGISVLAGGTAAAGDRELWVEAQRDDANYAIGENRYLAARATSLSYRAAIVTSADDTWSYQATTTLKLSQLAATFGHSDRNTLHRVASMSDPRNRGESLPTLTGRAWPHVAERPPATTALGP